jgi:uncharacterized protein YggE
MIKAGETVRLSLLVLALLPIVLAPPRAARAQFFGPNSGSLGTAANIEGLTVIGKGAVAARPNLLEIDLEVSAASELTADAIVKYRDARRKLQEAFAALKLANITVEERGLLVDKKGVANRYYFFMSEPNTRAKTEVQLSRGLIVKGTDIAKLDEEALLQLTAKLLDVAQDAGARLGKTSDFDPYFYYDYRRPEGLVRFVLEGFDKLQEEAYEKAIADAQVRAERLARLSKVELGPIVAVREIQVPGEPEDRRGDETVLHKRLVTSKFQEVPIKVELLVRFEVHSRTENNKPRAGE